MELKYKVSAIIPAYNEENTIGQVVATLKRVPGIQEIIVVSDGSRDATAEVARAQGAQVIELKENKGKGTAMMVGARRAKGDILLFLDADLEGLTAHHVLSLLSPLWEGRADMSIGIFHQGRFFTDLAQKLAPHLSGQRAIFRDLFLSMDIEESRFEIELWLTSEARARGWRVEKVPLSNMTHVVKEEKRGLRRGVRDRVGMYRDILRFLFRSWKKKIRTKPLILVVLLFSVPFLSREISVVRRASASQFPLREWEWPAGEGRFLIIAPHPDDESLGVGGLISSARKRGYPVKVVFMTNGDGFLRGVKKWKGYLPTSPEDFLQYGQLRQQEALEALSVLGVPPQDIIFLGYPDGGLAPIWFNYWGQIPYTAVYTRKSEVPYPLSYRYRQPYTASNLLANLEEIIETWQPTDIFVTDTSDSHPDHWASGAFLQVALSSVQARHPEYRPRLYTYIIHSGAWQTIPVMEPQRKILLPPNYFLSRDIQWYEFLLSSDILDKKKRAIAAHKSQHLVMSAFLHNFERPNEIFISCPVQRIKRASFYGYWPQETRIKALPPSKALLKRIERGGLKEARILQEESNLRIRLDTYGHKGLKVHYWICLYIFSPQGDEVRRFILRFDQERPRADMLLCPRDYDGNAIKVKRDGESWEIFLPRVIKEGDAFIMFSASAAWGKINMDRIPWCLLHLEGEG
ncbi:MAG TPA: glycosyltransferase [Moorella mulderi]|nr:glycosyltransferase [Moorella mulderi]